MQTVIQSFLEQFRNCPKCGYQLKITAKQKEEIDNPHIFKISIRNDRLIINIESDYFVSSNYNKYEFSISIVDGHIIYSDNTSKFISLYDLNIILSKKCINCANQNPKESFSQKINIFYDRDISAFAANPYTEEFSFSYQDCMYYFINDFACNRSFLLIKDHIRENFIETNFIPFEKFHFEDKEKLFSKINAIRLLL